MIKLLVDESNAGYDWRVIARRIDCYDQLRLLSMNFFNQRHLFKHMTKTNHFRIALGDALDKILTETESTIYIVDFTLDDFYDHFAPHVGSISAERVKHSYVDGFFMDAEGKHRCKLSL